MASLSIPQSKFIGDSPNDLGVSDVFKSLLLGEMGSFGTSHNAVSFLPLCQRNKLLYAYTAAILHLILPPISFSSQKEMEYRESITSNTNPYLFTENKRFKFCTSGCAIYL